MGIWTSLDLETCYCCNSIFIPDDSININVKLNVHVQNCIINPQVEYQIIWKHLP